MAARIVAVCVGLVLLFACAMKGSALLETTISPGRVASEWWVSLAGTGFEFFLGTWLLIGCFPRVARWLTLACFVGFLAVAVTKAVQGEESCGCLGNLRVSPWYTAVFDVAVVVAVGFARPRISPANWWKERLVLLAGVFALAVGGTFTLYVYTTDLSRGLVVRGENVIEFGEVTQNLVLTHTFTVENRGQYAVEVVQATSSCSCTTTENLDGKRVEPGGTLAIPVMLHTKESEEHLVGSITLLGRRVGSTAPPGYFQKLQVSAKVQPDYWVRPLILDLGEIDHDKPVVRTVALRPHRLPNVQIKGVETSHPTVAARLLDQRTPEGDLQVEVSFCGRPLTTTGSVSSTVTLHTDSSRRPDVNVLIQAHFRTPVTVTPQAVVVASDEVGEIKKEVTVSGLRPIQVEGLRGPAAVRTTLVQDSPTNWRIEVRFPADTPIAGPNTALTFNVRSTETADATEARAVAIPLHRLPPSRRGAP